MHQGVVLLAKGDTGEPVALLTDAPVTEIRTAAVSVFATEVLARTDSTELAVIGTGVQARAHVLALDAARPPTAVRIAGCDQAPRGRVCRPPGWPDRRGRPGLRHGA